MSVLHLLGPALSAAEQSRLPDAAIRLGIRRILAARRKQLLAGGCEAQQRRRSEFAAWCRQQPIAALPEQANEQHYELPPAFFQHVLGSRLKYSCCHWGPHTADLDEAEVASLSLTCERARLQNGQQILELGCGWGSLSLWMAERYPQSRITAVSNSAPQRQFIEQQIAARGIGNLQVRTADINSFEPEGTFDRVVSVEMFEHVRNHEELLRRIAGWLNAEGKLFVHHFAHRDVPYAFETTGEDDWMGRYFFSGGVMPCDDLLLHYQSDLQFEQQWRLSGRHYARTCNAWLERMDSQREAIDLILAETYGADQARLWRQRWRMFFMACAELFAYRGGNEWWVAHVLMGRA
jgi:cyclopropane-fatty-acyl-phospholipid synthase